MKVLWFTNVPPGAVSEKIGMEKYSGGWLTSLEKELSLSEDVELTVSFYLDKYLDEFRIGNTVYFPVYRKSSSSKLKRLINRSRNIVKSDNEELQQLLKVVHKVKPDLIHVHGTEDNFGLLAGKVKIPTAISVQGILSAIAEKFFSGIPMHVATKNEGIKIKILRKSHVILFKNMSRRLLRERQILKRTEYIIGRTEWDKRISEFLAPNAIYFTGNEILRNSFYECIWQPKISKNKIQIVTVLSPAIFKGLEMIAKTASLLSTYKDFDFEWSVVGLNEKDAIVRVVQKWLNADFNKLKVSFLGQKDEKNVLEILMDSNIFCQVSHIENSSNSLSEAMLIGMPIIASNVGGTSSMIQNERDGLLVQEGESFSTAAAIIELVKHWKLAIEYGKNARCTALKRHNRKLIVSELISVYKKIIGEKIEVNAPV
ncbi:MAG TPA: glycosyltransferase family 4 protein [Hanamia sp.]